MKKISFLLCLSMTFNNLAIEQASAKEANSYETCFVYENMDENKVSLEEIAKELFADPLCTTLNKKGHSCISPWQYNHVIQRLWTL